MKAVYKMCSYLMVGQCGVVRRGRRRAGRGRCRAARRRGAAAAAAGGARRAARGRASVGGGP